MLLVHNTNIKSLKKIIEDNKLKAAYLTNNLNEGYGLYKPKQQKYLFFFLIDNYNSKDDKKISGIVSLYFDTKLLWNRKYYISTCLSGNPSGLKEWVLNYENRKCKMYKREYKQYYKKTDKVLNNLYNNKNNTFNPQTDTQIAIKNTCNLKYLKKIKFLLYDDFKPSNKLLKLIKNNYPNVIIEIEK